MQRKDFRRFWGVPILLKQHSRGKGEISLPMSIAPSHATREGKISLPNFTFFLTSTGVRLTSSTGRNVFDVFSHPTHKETIYFQPEINPSFLKDVSSCCQISFPGRWHAAGADLRPSNEDHTDVDKKGKFCLPALA